MSKKKKKIWFKISPEDKDITLKDVIDKITKIQEENPDEEVYFDGDEFAICSIESDKKKAKKKDQKKIEQY
ncbi:MAG: hypothetical protein AB1779_07655 [Candidatus Thermoplasmatota archaeon]